MPYEFHGVAHGASQINTRFWSILLLLLVIGGLVGTWAIRRSRYVSPKVQQEKWLEYRTPQSP